MIYDSSMPTLLVFLAIVGFTIWLSLYLGKKARTAQGYFAAEVAFTGSSTGSRSPATISRPHRFSDLRHDRVLRL